MPVPKCSMSQMSDETDSAFRRAAYSCWQQMLCVPTLSQVFAVMCNVCTYSTAHFQLQLPLTLWEEVLCEAGEGGAEQ